MKIKQSFYIDNNIDTAAQVNPQYMQIHNSQYEFKDNFIFAMCENKKLSYVSGALTPSIKNWLFQTSENHIKEKIFLTALENLYKKIDYLQLTIQFDQELIDENEFDKELDTNEDRYLIKVNNDFSDIDFDLAISIVKKIKTREFSTDEIAEMFSIPLEKVESLLQLHELKNQFPLL